MAPLAATLAATAAMGVGLALARAGRPGRAAPPDARLGLHPHEPPAEGVRRMALAQVDLAITLLEHRAGPLDELAVHEIRKALKRLRALLRVVREPLGARSYARESRAVKQLAGRLAGARDAEVMLATLQALVERHPARLARRGGVRRLREQLTAERERMRRNALGGATARAEVLTDLRALRARVSDWRLPERRASTLVEPGLRRIYRQGRERYRRASRGSGDRVRTMHEWRKRVKDLRYAAEMLERREAGADGRWKRAAGRKRSRKDAAWLRQLGRRADELGEMLGEDHDLALLAELVRSGGPGAGGARLGRRTRKLLLKLIARRRRELRKRCLRAGARLYRRRPKQFAKRIRTAYAGTRRGVN